MGKSNLSVEERFDQKIYKDSDTNCWFWLGAKYTNGYGAFWDGKNQRLAHRYSFERYKNKNIKNKVICHKCDEKRCVNPSHLFSGTQSDNLKDMVSKNRERKKDTYKSGHEHCNAKMTSKKVIKMRNLYKTGKFSWIDLANKFNISKRCTGRILRNETYKNVK